MGKKRKRGEEGEKRNYTAIDTLRERKFQGAKVARNESSIELSFPGAKRPGAQFSKKS